MRIIATAKPNSEYRWINNYKGISIFVCLWNNEVRYYEEHTDGKRIRISEETAKSLFTPGDSITDQPFLVRDNLTFYIVTFRHKKRFIDKYHKLKHTLQ